MYGCLHYSAELCVRTALRGRYYVYPLQRLSAIAVKRRYYYYYYYFTMGARYNIIFLMYFNIIDVIHQRR